MKIRFKLFLLATALVSGSSLSLSTSTGLVKKMDDLLLQAENNTIN
ncbi:MAG TPA: hypothetical protein QGF02_03505 [Candidatus Babeliales bacterium]|nr:hypothetical protein [Candidatus Babeliales bacterium]